MKVIPKPPWLRYRCWHQDNIFKWATRLRKQRLYTCRPQQFNLQVFVKSKYWETERLRKGERLRERNILCMRFVSCKEMCLWILRYKDKSDWNQTGKNQLGFKRKCCQKNKKLKQNQLGPGNIVAILRLEMTLSLNYL